MKNYKEIMQDKELKELLKETFLQRNNRNYYYRREKLKKYVSSNYEHITSFKLDTYGTLLSLTITFFELDNSFIAVDYCLKIEKDIIYKYRYEEEYKIKNTYGEE